MTIRFAAVTEEPDEGWMGVSLADREHGDGWTLHLQCGWTEPDAQDVALGQDTHCLADGHGRTCYGGVVAAQLDRNVLSLRLSCEAVDVLGLDSDTVEMVLDLPAPLIGQVRDGVSRVLAYGDPRKRPRSVALSTVLRSD